MDMKLNPPIVENKTASQPLTTGTTMITIPFLMNKSVGWADFNQISLLIKTPQSNINVLTAFCPKENLIIKNGHYLATFAVSTQKLQIGQYYKAQLAYKDTANNLGFYSDVTIFKCTYAPSISIKNLKNNEINIHTYTYTGLYENLDKSEKVYSYEFNLYDSSNKLVTSSGEKLHNSSYDTETTKSINTWETRHGLASGIYFIEYKVKTISGMELSSPLYQLTNNETGASILKDYCELTAINNNDDGYVELCITPKQNNKQYISGQFVLTRAASNEKFEYWHELTRFVLLSHDIRNIKSIFKDFTVEQGITYKYAIQAYREKGIYSAREESQTIFADFEDMFLSDGDRQLKIRYNPKVTSFKNTLLESKTDTIGGPYPFFFRNGNICYKEFPISGLISLLMDENNYFMPSKQEDLTYRTSTKSNNITIQNLSTALSGENFKNEREFKMEVLQWLTNGKPKLFRSPGEGNFLVRLMNTSLSPNDQLSRMIHTFSCTAYEIDKYTFDNLQKYNIVKSSDLINNILTFSTTSLTGSLQEPIEDINNIYSIVIRSTPGTKFSYWINDSTKKEVYINNSQLYFFNQGNIPIKIKPTGLWPGDSYLTIAKYNNNTINYIEFIELVDEIFTKEKIIGDKDQNIITDLLEYEQLYSLGNISYLNIKPRPVVTKITKVQWDASKQEYIFMINNLNYIPKEEEIIQYKDEYYDGKTKQKINELDYSIQLRDYEESLNLLRIYESIEGCEVINSSKDSLILANVQNINQLKIGNALQIQSIEYEKIYKSYSNDYLNNALRQLKENYETADKANKESKERAYVNALDEYMKDLEEGILNVV